MENNLLSLTLNTYKCVYNVYLPDVIQKHGLKPDKHLDNVSCLYVCTCMPT